MDKNNKDRLIRQLGNFYSESISGKTINESKLIDFDIIEELSLCFAAARIQEAIDRRQKVDPKLN